MGSGFDTGRPDNQGMDLTREIHASAAAPPWRWDVFCRVVDNYGDLGVCRRLALHLAAQGQCVRLWVDDATLMARMAPDWPQADATFWDRAAPGVAWVHWTPSTDPSEDPGDVVVEAFGCDPPPAFVARMAETGRWGQAAPVWINLEYLSAESYVARSHGLPSPQLSGPGQGLCKWFFYPGFTPGTGGLLREQDLMVRRRAFDRQAWLNRWGVTASSQERVLSLFAYESAPLEALLQSLADTRNTERVRLLLTEGPLQARAQHWLQERPAAAKTLTLTPLPWLESEDFDHLLWACDLNFVRGEDSLVRALWAGVPLVWQLYPQHDGAHAAKLRAFWNWLQACGVAGAGVEPPPNGRAAPAAAPFSPAVDDTWPWWQAWNGLGPWPQASAWPWDSLPAWASSSQTARAALLAQPSLAAQLLHFVARQRLGG